MLRVRNLQVNYGVIKAVKGISIEVEEADTRTITGANGAGKSTLVNLLPAFYELTSGRITIDGQDIGGIALDSLRRPSRG